jgi:hypothetical protein
MSGLFRYLKEPQDADGDALFWPGGPGGFPFRGQMPQAFKDEEYAALRPVCKVRCRTFYLSKEEDLREYMAVRAKCENQIYFIKDRERLWDEATGNYRIFLEWVEPAYEAPAPNNPAADRNSDNPSGVSNDAIASLVSTAKNTTTLPYSRLAGVPSKNGW